MEASITFKKIGQVVDGKSVIAGMTFGIERGSTVAIIGDNEDSGITEFLRIVAGISEPNYGELYIHGLDYHTRRSEIRKLVGYVPFENDMDPWLSVEQNIRFIDSLYDIDEEQLSENIAQYSKALELTDVLSKQVNKLTPGVLRKATILREIIRDPKVLVLDHPIAFMNAQDRALTWKLLRQCKGQKTIIYTSSSFADIEHFHDRILVMHNSKIDLDDNLENMLNNWTGHYRFQIGFERLLKQDVRKLEKLLPNVSIEKIDNSIQFFGNDRSVMLTVLSKLKELTIIDIDEQKLTLRDLLSARYVQEGIAWSMH